MKRVAQHLPESQEAPPAGENVIDVETLMARCWDGGYRDRPGVTPNVPWNEAWLHEWVDQGQTVVHLRQALRVVFDVLRREGEIAVNPVDDAAMPRFRAEVRKERAVLTDEELGAYLGYAHPDKRHRMAVLQRQTMACVARCFGGLRTGDLHALDWSALDAAQGAFEWGWAPRKKTKRPQLLEVPPMLRGILRDWWERHGRPTSGPVFPTRRGKRAGEKKGKVSHAKAFRRDLRRAFGVDVWDAEACEFKAARALTRRERELFEETEFTLPVDFHSWRRAFTQALGDADVNAQQATALAGHASLAAHARYLASSGKLPKGARSGAAGGFGVGDA